MVAALLRGRSGLRARPRTRRSGDSRAGPARGGTCAHRVFEVAAAPPVVVGREGVYRMAADVAVRATNEQSSHLTSRPRTMPV
jgi:hypothetical protein